MEQNEFMQLDLQNKVLVLWNRLTDLEELSQRNVTATSLISAAITLLGTKLLGGKFYPPGTEAPGEGQPDPPGTQYYDGVLLEVLNELQKALGLLGNVGGSPANYFRP